MISLASASSNFLLMTVIILEENALELFGDVIFKGLSSLSFVFSFRSVCIVCSIHNL